LVITILLSLLWIAPVGAILFWGQEYYLTPISERAHSDLHSLFKPSGTIGIGLGIVGTASIVLGVGIYGLRKRVHLLGRLGELAIWLELHIYLCTLGPVLILFHTAFKFGGIVSIAFWCMMIVAVSGFFGRYLFAHIPSAIHGQFRSLEALRVEQEELVESIKRDFGAHGEEVEKVLASGTPRRPRGFLQALVIHTRHALSKRKRVRKIEQLMSRRGAHRNHEQPLYLRETLIELVRRQVELEQQIVLLQPFQAVFKFWHIMHIPLTIVMFVIVAGHIAVAILFGSVKVF